MLSSIRQGFKCGGGTLVFKPCDSWISFALDSSSALSSADFQTQLTFVSNAIYEINHAERLQLLSVNGSLANWYGPFSIPYIQSRMINSTIQNGEFNLNATLSAIYTSYAQTFAVSNSHIGAIVFVSDTSSPSNYEGADNVVNILKTLGFRFTFILMGPNVNQTFNPQPDNWDSAYLKAYACPT
ncbi:hypothetical protein FO519_009417 [Halicephalobus sp. NKZ332]|nr:hypothetical protein FO519_009417 [Halicephalobus sp. NKZ332]